VRSNSTFDFYRAGSRLSRIFLFQWSECTRRGRTGQFHKNGAIAEIISQIGSDESASSLTRASRCSTRERRGLRERRKTAFGSLGLNHPILHKAFTGLEQLAGSNCEMGGSGHPTRKRCGWFGDHYGGHVCGVALVADGLGIGDDKRRADGCGIFRNTHFGTDDCISASDIRGEERIQ
jgi:hypothetical protein